MATNYEYDDEDDFNDEGTDAVKQLRKVNRTLEKRLKEIEAEYGNLKSQSRQRSVKDVLTSKGVRPSIAKYIPDDISDEEGISAWLKDNAEDFGINLDSTPAEQASSAKVDTSAQARINNVVSTGTPPGADEDSLAKILAAADPRALDAILGINSYN
jgi:hypothetical protein